MRGVLHWGYYPELEQPWPSGAQMRREIAELKLKDLNAYEVEFAMRMIEGSARSMGILVEE